MVEANLFKIKGSFFKKVDVYFKIYFRGNEFVSSIFYGGNNHPIWNQTFILGVTDNSDSIRIEVYSEGKKVDTLIGYVDSTISKII